MTSSVSLEWESIGIGEEGNAGIPSAGILEDGEVRVNLVRLDVPTSEPGSNWDLLAAQEQIRANRLLDNRVRDQFVVTRAALRRLLAQQFACPPLEVDISLSQEGKPFTPIDPDLHFNLSHAGDLALIVIARGTRVGIDLERYDAVEGFLKVAEFAFAPQEMERLLATPAKDRRQEFTNIWVRKEAYYKARGGGEKLRSEPFVVDHSPPPGPALLAFDSEPDEVGRWFRVPLPELDGFAAALVVDRPRGKVRYCHFEG